MENNAFVTIECKEAVITVFGSFTHLLDPKGLIPHPDNNNLHSKSQIKDMITVLKTNGWRDAVVVSEKTQKIVSGHCRVLAAIEMGMEKIPVQMQYFENRIEEVRHLTAHNEIGRQSKFDKLKFRETKSTLEGELDPNEAQTTFFNPSEWGMKGYPVESAPEKAPLYMLLREEDQFQLGPHTLTLGMTTDKNEKYFQDFLKKWEKVQKVKAIHVATGKNYDDLMAERMEDYNQKKKKKSNVVDLKKKKS